MAPPITGTSYNVGVYEWQRGKRKEKSMRPVINGEPHSRTKYDNAPEEARDVDPIMLVTIKSGTESHIVLMMLRALIEKITRESSKRAREESM